MVMVISSLLGITVFFGILWYAARSWALPWRLVSDAYETSALPPALATRSVQQVVIVGGGLAFRKYVPVTVAIHDDGLSLVAFAALWPFCPKVFLPFAEMSVQRTSWYLDSGCHGIRMTRVEGVEIVVDDDLLGWIRGNCDRV